MAPYNVLLITGEPKWTSRALHLACAMARSNDGQVTLLRMVPAGHPALLGAPEGLRNVTDGDRLMLAELAITAEKYNVPVEVRFCAYANYAHALTSAAEQLHASAVFAALPPSRLPWWARFQQWRVQTIMARYGCALHTLAPAGGPMEWAPSATQVAPAPRAPHSRKS